MINRNKYTELLIYIISQINPKNLGKTKLYKTLFFCDLESVKKLGYKLTEDKYLKYPMGPVPEKGWSMLTLLSQNGDIDITTDIKGGKLMYLFKNKRDADLSVFTEGELKIIKNVVKACALKSRLELIVKSHDEPWKSANNWGEIVLNPDSIKSAKGISFDEDLAKDTALRYSDDIESLSAK